MQRTRAPRAWQTAQHVPNAPHAGPDCSAIVPQVRHRGSAQSHRRWLEKKRDKSQVIAGVMPPRQRKTKTKINSGSTPQNIVSLATHGGVGHLILDQRQGERAGKGHHKATLRRRTPAQERPNAEEREPVGRGGRGAATHCTYQAQTADLGARLWRAARGHADTSMSEQQTQRAHARKTGDACQRDAHRAPLLRAQCTPQPAPHVQGVLRAAPDTQPQGPACTAQQSTADRQVTLPREGKLLRPHRHWQHVRDTSATDQRGGGRGGACMQSSLRTPAEHAAHGATCAHPRWRCRERSALHHHTVCTCHYRTGRALPGRNRLADGQSAALECTRWRIQARASNAAAPQRQVAGSGAGTRGAARHRPGGLRARRP